MRKANTRTEQATGSVRDCTRGVLAAAALLLRAPDERICAQLQASGATSGQPLAALRQSFYDRFCIPQSGLYIPPFEHVFRQGKKISNRWHFPPARYDGACAVDAVYTRFGFRHTQLDVEPILRAPHLPGDHLGFMLAFAGWTLQGADLDPAMRPELVSQLEEFITTHLAGWVETYCGLLRESEPHGYAAAVGDAVSEAISEVRRAVTQAMGRT